MDLSIDQHRRPAVVVGGSLNALGVVRSLARYKVPVTVVSTSALDVASWSRGAASVVIPALHGKSLIDSLVRLRAKFDSDPVMISTDELATFTLSEYRDRIAPIYRLTLPNPEMVEALCDKAKFQALAEECGLPVPRSVVVDRAGDSTILAQVSLPVVVKPADKRAVHSGQTDRITIIETRAELEQTCERLRGETERLVVQEWIPGPDSNIYFCLFFAGSDNRIASCFAGRKIEVDPPGIGNTGICIAAPEFLLELRELTARFVERVGFAGLGSMEYKRHERTGQFIAVEPTVGRTDWQEEIATLCGENIPAKAYAFEAGVVLESRDVPRSVGWRASRRNRWPDDIPFCVDYVHDGLWRVDDPLPGIVGALRGSLRIVKKGVHGIARKSTTKQHASVS